VLVAADETVPATFIAADLLAQAEHGADSQVIFVTDSDQLVENVLAEINNQLVDLQRAEIAKAAIQNSTAIVVPVEKWTAIINEYAPEHLILSGKYEDLVVKEVINAGSVFLGMNTAESFGDYASGTNHTLPTAGFARAYSGVSLDSFVKKITFQRIEDTGLTTLGPVVIQLAEAEQLQAHANAVTVRLNRKGLRL
jgi:histidinol dehydrogenase